MHNIYDSYDITIRISGSTFFGCKLLLLWMVFVASWRFSWGYQTWKNAASNSYWNKFGIPSYTLQKQPLESLLRL